MNHGFLYRRHVNFLQTILNNLHCGRLALTLPDGSHQVFAGAVAGPDADMHIHTGAALRRLLYDGKMGFCEAFMDGEVSSCLLYTSPSPRDRSLSRMPSSA